MNIKNFFYSITCISLCIPFGAGLYEHIAVWPNAYSELPKSLAMFQGPYGLEPAPFWMAIHPVTVVLFAITLFLHWKTTRRNSILIPFAIYFGILVITAIYFVPNLMLITNTPYSDTVDSSLQKMGDAWEAFSWVRLVIGYFAVYLLIIGLTKIEN